MGGRSGEKGSHLVGKTVKPSGLKIAGRSVSGGGGSKLSVCDWISG